MWPDGVGLSRRTSTNKRSKCKDCCRLLKRPQNENSNRNDIKAYGLNAGQIAKRADRLVNLNFLVSNAKKRREPNISDFQDKINYN